MFTLPEVTKVLFFSFDLLIFSLLHRIDFLFKAKSDPTEWTSRFVNWGEFRCHGRIQRTICIFGFADLPLLSSRHEFIANKFQLKVDPIAYQCQEERIIERSRNDLVQTSINLSIYERMPFLLD